MAVELTKQAQKFNVPTVWIDVEGTASAENMTQLGANPEEVFLFQPEDGETITIEAVTKKIKDIVKAFEGTGMPIMIIWDSVAITATEQEMKDNFNHNQMGKLTMPI